MLAESIIVSRGMFVPQLAHFGKHFLPTMACFDLKLAETALLFYRVTDVPFLPKVDQNW